MSKALITLAGTVPTFTVSLTPEAERLKSEALALGVGIIGVESDEDQSLASNAMQVIKGLIDMAEKTRKGVKEPVLSAGKMIDATAKGYSTELETELDRIKRLVGNYQMAQRRAAEEAARKAADAARKAQEEAQRAEALRAREEQLKLEMEAAKGREATKLKAQLEETRTERIDAELGAFEAEDAAAVAPVIVQKAQGAAVAPSFEITVTDIKALYAAFPMAVRLEANMMILKDMVSRQGHRDIPGVSIKESVQVRVSGVAPAIALR